MLGSETRHRRWAGIRPREVLLKPPAPRAPGLLDRGQAKQGPWVRPDRPAHASSAGVRRGLGGARAAQAATGIGQVPGRQVPAAPTSQAEAGFPRPLSKRLVSHLARTAWDPGEGGPGSALARSDERLGFDWIFIGDTSQARAQPLSAESAGWALPSGSPADLLRGASPQRGAGGEKHEDGWPAYSFSFPVNVNGIGNVHGAF